MPTPATEHSLNLKYRLTGAVILIGIAVLVVSGLLGRSEPVSRNTEPYVKLPLNDGFVSRIKSTEDGGAPKDTLTQKHVDNGDSAGSNTLSPTKEPVLQPVLKQENRLPRPKTGLNTVIKSMQTAQNKPKPKVKPVSQSALKATKTTWLVRVGTFSNKKNATGIVRKLGQSGYKASTADVTISGKSMIRVSVGPFVDRKAATRAKSDIAKAYDLNGFVVRQN